MLILSGVHSFSEHSLVQIHHSFKKNTGSLAKGRHENQSMLGLFNYNQYHLGLTTKIQRTKHMILHWAAQRLGDFFDHITTEVESISDLKGWDRSADVRGNGPNGKDRSRSRRPQKNEGKESTTRSMRRNIHATTSTAKPKRQLRFSEKISFCLCSWNCNP